MVRFHWTMSKRPSHGRVALPQLGVPDYIVWYSPCGGVSPFWEPLALLAICLRKSVHPQDGVLENHQGSGKLSPVRLAASTVRGGSGSPLSLFPRGHNQFPPIRVQAVSPVRRKPRDPWGSGWPRLGPSMGESGPWANPMKNLRIASQVINLDLEIHVGQNNDVRKGWCACSGSTPRMREVERKKQKGESNHGLRICRQWFRQLGHGLIVSYLRSNQTRYFCCYSATSPWALHRFFELHFQKYICGWCCFSCRATFLRVAKKKRIKRYWAHRVPLSYLGCYDCAVVNSKPARKIYIIYCLWKGEE